MNYAPTKGFQENYLASEADVTVGGAKAGVGKSFATILDPLQYILDPNIEANFRKARGVFFRRTMPEHTQGGGLWDEASEVYENAGATIQNGRYKVNFANGARLEFTHLQYEKTVLNHKGGQYTWIYFDELTSFLRSQFIYMISRNRSGAKILPTVKATTNPEGFGWVKELVSWYIYPDNYKDPSLAGLPIPERIGALRYFIAFEGRFIWGDSREEVASIAPEEAIDWDLPLEDQILSFTFIPGELEDNIFQDPAYRSRLMAQGEEDKLRLLGGSWKAYDNPESLFRSGGLQDIFTNEFVPLGGKRYLTADLAFEGRDKFVVAVWEGWRIIQLFSFPKTDGEQIIDYIRAIAEEYGIPQSNIAYDAAGVGMFAKGFLKSSIAYNSNLAPWALKGSKEKQNYYKLRDQIHYIFANIINNPGNKRTGAPGLFVEPGTFTNVDDKDELLRQLRAVYKKANGTGPLRISTKDEIVARLGCSPDILEAVVLRVLFMLERPGKKRRPSARQKPRK